EEAPTTKSILYPHLASTDVRAVTLRRFCVNLALFAAGNSPIRPRITPAGLGLPCGALRLAAGRECCQSPPRQTATDIPSNGVRAESSGRCAPGRRAFPS